MATVKSKAMEKEGRERVKTLVTEFSEVWRKRIEADYRKRAFKAVREFLLPGAVLVEWPTKYYSREWHRDRHHKKYWERFADRVDLGMYANFSRGKAPDVYTLKPGWRHELRKAVKRAGDEAVAAFVFKVTEKLLNVVDRIPGHFTVETYGELWRSTLKFKWESGVEFRVENKIVYAVRTSHGGWTEYNSFPLTFHNVLLEDGSKMKIPSEAKMKKHFGGVDNKPKELTTEDKKKKRKPDNMRWGKGATSGKPMVFGDCPVCGKTVSGRKNYSGYHFNCLERREGCGWSGYSRNSY